MHQLVVVVAVVVVVVVVAVVAAGVAVGRLNKLLRGDSRASGISKPFGRVVWGGVMGGLGGSAGVILSVCLGPPGSRQTERPHRKAEILLAWLDLPPLMSDLTPPDPRQTTRTSPKSFLDARPQEVDFGTSGADP